MAGNLILGGVIGIGVDAATGAAKDLTPNSVHVLLGKEGEESKLVNVDEKKIDQNAPTVAVESNGITAQEELTSQSENSDTAIQE